MGHVTLVLGGARSGKSAYAEGLFEEGQDTRVLYVATARPWPGDENFADRIALHQQRRPASWVTVDDVDAVDVLATTDEDRVLVDDLGTWLTHTIDQHSAWEKPAGTLSPVCDELLAAVRSYKARRPDGQLVIVTPEVGLSVIPEHHSGRLFRDELGRLNAQVAEIADEVVLIVAGCRLVLKGN